jgi:hypothetical protein
MLILMYLSVLRCKMLKIKSTVSGVPDFYTSPYLVQQTEVIGFDPDNQEIVMGDECRSFLNDNYVSLDTKWISGITLHIIGVAWGACLWVGLLVSFFFMCPTCCHRASGCGWIVICTLFTGLTFLSLDSNLCTDNPVLNKSEIQDLYKDECELGSGSIVLIIGIAMMFLTGLMTCAISGKDTPPKEKEEVKEKEKETKNEKEAR